ncbi:MAG: hypothetical protein ACP5JE_04975, partial [Thermoplasmata archaeon]
NEAVYNPWGYGWYVLQTNGTIAHSSSWINPSAWNYFSLPRLKYLYPDILNITDSCSKIFTVFSNYSGSNSKGIYNLMYFNLTFLNSTQKSRIQFKFDNNLFYYYEQIINISSTEEIYVNISFIVNDAYNSTLYFYVYSYPQGNRNIIIAYQLKIILINHFNYIPI